ncbi:hypothetical protein D9M71_457490 [compost metagenome]
MPRASLRLTPVSSCCCSCSFSTTQTVPGIALMSVGVRAATVICIGARFSAPESSCRRLSTTVRSSLNDQPMPLPASSVSSASSRV